MAPLAHIEGFESGVLTGGGAGAALETTTVRTGAGSLKLTPTSGGSGTGWSGGLLLGTATYISFRVRVTVLPSLTRLLYGVTGANSPNVRLTATGALEFRNDTTVLGTSATLLTDTTLWYRVELKSVLNAWEMKIDGTSQVTSAAPGAGTLPANFTVADTVASSYTAFIDDIVGDTAAYPGDVALVLLVPTADSQRGSWTGGAGGTTNLWDAVNNRPPTGTATETDSTQIESIDGSGDNSVDEYLATMTTYTAAGVPAGATVNALVYMIWHGEDVTTGTKTGSYKIFSNPDTGIYQSFTFGDDVGLLGTWPSSWSVSAVEATAPTVTLGTAPVMALRKTDAGVRVASVCFLGIYVDFTPSAGALPPDPQIVSVAVKTASTW